MHILCNHIVRSKLYSVFLLFNGRYGFSLDYVIPILFYNFLIEKAFLMKLIMAYYIYVNGLTYYILYRKKSRLSWD